MRPRRRPRTACAGVLAGGATLALALALAPAGTAAACTLCQVMAGESLKAYIGPTILLSAVPVAILGSIALWLRRNSMSSRAGGNAIPHMDTYGDAGDSNK